MSCQWQKVNCSWPEEKCTYTGTIQEIPVEKSKTILCKTQLVNGRNIYLYVRKDSMARQLSIGDDIYFYAQVRSPKNDGYTGDFNYATYLLYKGISGTSFVSSKNWRKGNQVVSLSWKQRALLLREEMVDWYKEWGISEKTLPVLAALTLGYKQKLDDEIKEAYSVAGISHVLALSGMHIGFLWMLLNVLLKPLSHIGVTRWLKWIVTTFLLWAFAFIAGLEASVVRAVVMCMLVDLGKVSGGRVLSLNTWAVAAFFMLFYRPFYLFDVGFQLSFLAVLSILLFYPFLMRYCTSHRTWFRRVGSVLSVSIAAQLGTAPLVMYYYSNFSICFLLSNLVVALWVPCIIYIAFVALVASMFSIDISFVTKILRWLVETLNDFAGFVSDLPYASITSIKVHVVEVVAMYISIGVFFLYINTRKRRVLILGLATIAFLLGIHCVLLLDK